MTVNKKIITALKEIAPVYPDFNARPDEKEYIAFTYFTRPALNADDAPLYEIYHVSVHYFAPLFTDVWKNRKAIKKKLFAAGFTWPDEIPASDEDGQHFVYECTIEEDADVDGEFYV